MGTRVDFYVGRGESAEWLGSYPFDGNPGGVFGDPRDFPGVSEIGVLADYIPEAAWREWVTGFLSSPENTDRATLPEMGWPWPWDDSRTTDYTYARDEGAVYGSCFGHAWFRVDPNAGDWGEPEDYTGDKVAIFPNMAGRKDVTYGPRSGLIVMSFPRGDA